MWQRMSKKECKTRVNSDKKEEDAKKWTKWRRRTAITLKPQSFCIIFLRAATCPKAKSTTWI